MNIIAFILENKSTIILAVPMLGRAYHALRNGGGLVGIWKSLMFGETPKKGGQDAPAN